MRRAAARGALAPSLLLLLAVVGCATASFSPTCRVVEPVPAWPAAEVAASLFLVGDGGAPGPGTPVAAALRTELRRQDEGRLAAGGVMVPTVVALLGDNVYGRAPLGGEAAAARLRPWVEALAGTRARLVAIPGNHDWRGRRDAGGQALAAEAGLLARLGREAGVEVAFAPTPGCPGPEVVEVGDSLRLIALDTAWWLRRASAAADCRPADRQGVVDGLRRVLAAPFPGETIVLAHHPLASGGPHGGRFGPRRHLFPFGRGGGGRGLPLPGVGSAVLLGRRLGLDPHDLAAPRYRRMRAALAAAAAENPPLAWAGGHDHTLQVVDLDEVGVQLVSGAGSPAEIEPVGAVAGSLFCSARPGWLRLDLARDGRVRVVAVEVGAAEAVEVWSTVLTRREGAGRPTVEGTAR